MLKYLLLKENQTQTNKTKKTQTNKQARHQTLTLKKLENQSEVFSFQTPFYVSCCRQRWISKCEWIDQVLFLLEVRRDLQHTKTEVNRDKQSVEMIRQIETKILKMSVAQQNTDWSVKENRRQTGGSFAYFNIERPGGGRWHPQGDKQNEHGCAGTAQMQRTRWVCWQMNSTEHSGTNRYSEKLQNLPRQSNMDKYPMVGCYLMELLSTLRLHHGCTDCRWLTKNLGWCWICKDHIQELSFAVLWKKQCVRLWKWTAGGKKGVK